MARGNLRIFLGAAPGAGKTFAMLEEGRRLLAEGADVVVGAVSVRGRAETEALLQGLEQCPPSSEAARSAATDLDVGAILDRAPGVVLVDEYAGTNSRSTSRWDQVAVLLDAGIDVISTLDIRQLESLSDVVRSITGTREQNTVPDKAVRGADQIELVDASPELLRRRLGEGKIYPSQEEADLALAGDFRTGTLTALRELALLWLAERVDAGLSDYRTLNNIRDSWQTREKIVVGLSGQADGQALIRRAARMLASAAGGELHVVHVRTGTDEGELFAGKELELQRKLAQDAGGVFHTVGGEDVAETLLEFARSINASQIILGASRQRRLAQFGRGIVAKVLRTAGGLDIHLVAQDAARTGSGRRTASLGRRRELPAFALAAGLPPLLQLALDLLPHQQLSTDMLVQLTGIVAVALVGGLWPAVVAAALAGLIVNYFSVRPIGSLSVLDPENVLALLIFLVVAVAVSLVVDRSAKRSKEARLAGAEASILGELSRRAVAEGNSIPDFLEQVREHFQAAGAGLWIRRQTGHRKTGDWTLHEYSGAARPEAMTEADSVEQLDGDRILSLTGRELSQDERRLLAAFGAHLLAMLQREELTASQRENLRLAEGNTMRTSILRAVSHDLRTPLAGIKLASSSLRDRTITFGQDEQEELLATIESGADRLDRLVEQPPGHVQDHRGLRLAADQSDVLGRRRRRGPPGKRLGTPAGAPARQHASGRRGPRHAGAGHRQPRGERAEVRAGVRRRHRRSGRRFRQCQNWRYAGQ